LRRLSQHYLRGIIVLEKKTHAANRRAKVAQKPASGKRYLGERPNLPSRPERPGGRVPPRETDVKPLLTGML
jgi:hypothetical protein